MTGVRTYFCYADEGLVAEFDASGNQIKSYGYRPGSTWTTDPLFMEQGGRYYFYHNDHLGTPQQMTSVSGAVVWAAEYEAFGQAMVDASSTVTNNLRFPGQYYDEETGMHYNWNRYYEPGTGRYLTVDPLINNLVTKRNFTGQFMIGISKEYENLYSYVSSNSIIRIDSNALSWCSVKCMSGLAFYRATCNFNASMEHLACYDEVIISRDCLKKAEEKHKQCLKYAENWYANCLKGCECE
ncbi:MAG TPA: RHS repeat-associated core domain-containing protein [Methanothrix soehngenii]|jgi:RHS repeat-associated protein|nr:RHS repeat-associated core domain-containing protein [Methanothrix soehngenii]